MKIRLIPSLLGLVTAAALSAAAYADPLQVTIGYQTNVTPAQAAITEGAYEKASGATIDWRKFDTGPDVVTAVASGDVQIGYVGSSPTAAAISHRLPAEVGQWGSPTFDVWVVRKDFAAAHPDFVTQFVKVTSDYDADYLAHPEDFAADSANAAAIAKITRVQAADVPAQLTEAVWPTASQLASPALLEGGTAKAVASTAALLKQQGKIESVLPNYAPYVTAKFAQQAAQ